MKSHFLHKPSVSVILPVYNRRHLVKKAIDSVIKQTCDDWELLVIDDGSDDHLYAVVLSLQTNDVVVLI